MRAEFVGSRERPALAHCSASESLSSARSARLARYQALVLRGLRVSADLLSVIALR